MSDWVRSYGFLLVTCLVGGAAWAQAAPDADQPLRQAQALASAGRYAQARPLLTQLLAQQPDHHDARTLLARTHAWEKQYDLARPELRRVLAADPDHYDALNAATDVGLWSGQPEEALAFADLGLGYYPNSEELLLKKAKALIALQRTDEAAEVLNRLLTVNPANAEAAALLATLRQAVLRHFVGVQYYLSLLSNDRQPWHLVSAEYGHKFDKLTLIARLNYANRFGLGGYQGEVDAYPVLGKGTYAYLNAGYSGALTLFPRWRAGAELFQKLPRGFEVSGGARWLNFPRLSLMLYTASVSKYHRQFLFSLRGFASFQGGGIAPTVLASARWYVAKAHPDDWVSLTVGYGAVPAVTTLTFFNPDQVQQLRATRLAVDFQKGIGHNFYLTGGVWHEYEEYFETRFRNRYTLHAGLQKRF